MPNQPFLTRVITATITIIAIFVTAYFLWHVRSIVFLLGMGILFGSVLDPAVMRLRRLGISRGQGLLAIYIVLFGALAAGIYFLVPLVGTQMSAFDKAIPGIFDNLREQALHSHIALIREQGFRAVLQAQNAWTHFRSNPDLKPTQAYSFINSVFSYSLSLISMLIVTFYWTVEKTSVKRYILGLFPFAHRARAHSIWDDIEYRIGGWARGQLLLMLAIGVITGVVWFAIGLRFWLALAVLAGFTEAIPYLGPIIAGSVSAVVALTSSPQKALLVLVLTFLIQQLEGALLVPRIMKHSVGMTPLTVVLAVLIGNVLAGPAGSIIAIPLGAAAQVIGGSLIRSRDEAIALELRSMDISPLAPSSLDTPFVEPNKKPISLASPGGRR